MCAFVLGPRGTVVGEYGFNIRIVDTYLLFDGDVRVLPDRFTLVQRNDGQHFRLLMYALSSRIEPSFLIFVRSLSRQFLRSKSLSRSVVNCRCQKSDSLF